MYKFKNKLKNPKAITLIALVITIVVLIILAGITISMTIGNNGIITRAREARNLYINAQEEEQVRLNVLAEQLANGETGSDENKSPKSTIDLTAGTYIKYNTGLSNVGENGVVICRVLYDANSEYGLQIIADKNIADVTLGGNDWATGRDSYNNAITTLNTEAGKYLNRAYATDARCVGSVPTIKNGTFINKNSENAGPVTLQFGSSVAGANSMKGEDVNYKTDKAQLESLNIWKTGENYWLASRRVLSDPYGCNFYVRDAYNIGLSNDTRLCNIDDKNSKTYGYAYSLGLRPCFSLKSDIKITGGNGTSEDPYIMEERQLTAKDLPEGAYIKYNTGVSSVGTNGVVTCRVLYDASSEYGVQIITDKNIANLILGKDTDWAISRDSYNNAITTLNKEAEKYINTKYVVDARCVGSMPTNQNGTFINKNSENAGPVKLQFTSSVAGVNNMKGVDTNYEKDKAQLECLNIWTTGEWYCLASRNVSLSSSYCKFYVRIVKSDGNWSSGTLCVVDSDSRTSGSTNSSGLRPCFSLKSDIKITGGSGTSENPYTM